MLVEANKDEIKELFYSIFNQELSTNIYSRIIKYEENSDILGFIIFDFIYDRMEISYIGVKEEYRNKLIATKLMEYTIQFAKNNSVENISLEVRVDNENAINLYKKFGFSEVSIRKNYYKNVDAYLMVKEV